MYYRHNLIYHHYAHCTCTCNLSYINRALAMLNVDNTCILWQGTDVEAHVFKNKIFLERHVVKWYICVVEVITSMLHHLLEKSYCIMVLSLSFLYCSSVIR